MIPIRTQIGRELRWRRTRLLPTEYELTSSVDLVGRLRFMGWLRRSAVITLAEDRWLIRPPGLITRSLIVERLEDSEHVATYRGGLRTGHLTFTNGDVYTISRQGLIPLSIRVQNATGSMIVSIHWSWPSFRNAGRVEIGSAGSAEPRLGLITAVAFNVLVLRRRRAARSGG